MVGHVRLSCNLPWLNHLLLIIRAVAFKKVTREPQSYRTIQCPLNPQIVTAEAAMLATKPTLYSTLLAFFAKNFSYIP